MATTAISGSASGIGAAVRERLEKDGDRVIGIDLRGAEVEADLSAPAGRAQAVAAVREACGGALDRLVLCAGLGPHVEDAAKIASVNYFGAVDLLDGLVDCLAGRRDASAVVVASNSAQLGSFEEHPAILALLDGDEARAHALLVEDRAYVAYAGSKHALVRAMRRRAEAFGAAGVRLNAVAPGPTRTPLLEATARHPFYGKAIDALPIPLGRQAEPAEIAAIVAFLLGRDAAYVHGSVLYADGGTDARVRPDRF